METNKKNNMAWKPRKGGRGCCLGGSALEALRLELDFLAEERGQLG